MVSGAFISGLHPWWIFKDLIAKPPTSLEGLFNQTHNFNKAEDANNENQLWEPLEVNCDTKQHATYRDLPRRQKDKFVPCSTTRYNEHYRVSWNSFTALIKSPAEIFTTTKAKSIIWAPSKMFTPSNKRDRMKYCEFHDDHGHDTNDSIDLRKKIEECIRNGWLSYLDKGTKKHNNSQTTFPSRPRGSSKPQIEWNRKVEVEAKPKNEIHMTQHDQIAVTSSRPSYLSIIFSEDDTILGNCTGDNSVIITENIRYTQIHRVYIDTESSTQNHVWTLFRTVENRTKEGNQTTKCSTH